MDVKKDVGTARSVSANDIGLSGVARPRSVWAPERIDSLCEMLAEGMTYAEVAEKLGTTQSAVSGRVDRLRASRDPRLPAAAVRKVASRVQRRVDCPADFAELAPNTGNADLCRRYGVCDRLISRWRRETNTVAFSVARTIPDNFTALAPTMTLYMAQQVFERSAPVLKRWAEETGVRFRQPTIIRNRGSSAQVLHETKRDMSFVGQAAEYLQKFSYVYRCNAKGGPDPKGEFWRRGSFVLTDAEIIERAQWNGWDADAWKKLAA